MAIIKNIEDKIKINKLVSIMVIIASIIIAVVSTYFGYAATVNANKTIYVLSDNTPIMALRTDFDVNRPVEYRAQIDYFHSLFFNLTPDDNFIENQMKKAMYLIDESGVQQYRNMKEKGWFSSIISSNSVVKLMTDSIHVDMATHSFIFYGKQIIDRKTSRVTRTLITTGNLKDIPRSENNAHGILLENWKTIENKQISFQERY